jgi:hypothetical protein
MIEMALQALIVSDADVAALIGDRCYPVEAPQAPVYPLVIVREITNESAYALDGPAGLGRARFQFDCDARTAKEVQALMRAVRAALGGFRGPVTIAALSPPATVKIQGAFLVMSRDEAQGTLQRSGTRNQRKSLDFNIWYEESDQ